MRFCRALRRDHGCIRLPLRDLTSLFSFLFLLLDGQPGLLRLLFGDLLLFHCLGIRFAEVDIPQYKVDQA